MTEQEKKFITDNAGLVFVGLLELVGNNNQYCPVLGGACKYVVDGKCTAAVCERRGK